MPVRERAGIRACACTLVTDTSAGAVADVGEDDLWLDPVLCQIHRTCLRFSCAAPGRLRAAGRVPCAHMPAVPCVCACSC